MSGKSGFVVRLIRYPARGMEAETIQSALFTEGRGIEGDCHAIGGERQLSLLSGESRAWMKTQTIKGLCFSRFKENITTRGLDLEAIGKGMRLEAGEAVIEISGETKHCHEECPLFSAGMACRIAGQSLFAKVIKSGEVKTGFTIKTIDQISFTRRG